MNLGTLGQEWLIVATPEGYAVKKFETRGEYSISTYGMSLFPIIIAMNEWGTGHIKHLNELYKQDSVFLEGTIIYITPPQ